MLLKIASSGENSVNNSIIKIDPTVPIASIPALVRDKLPPYIGYFSLEYLEKGLWESLYGDALNETTFVETKKLAETIRQNLIDAEFLDQKGSVLLKYDDGEGSFAFDKILSGVRGLDNAAQTAINEGIHNLFKNVRGQPIDPAALKEDSHGRAADHLLRENNLATRYLPQGEVAVTVTSTRSEYEEGAPYPTRYDGHDNTGRKNIITQFSPLRKLFADGKVSDANIKDFLGKLVSSGLVKGLANLYNDKDISDSDSEAVKILRNIGVSLQDIDDDLLHLAWTFHDIFKMVNDKDHVMHGVKLVLESGLYDRYKDKVGVDKANAVIAMMFLHQLIGSAYFSGNYGQLMNVFVVSDPNLVPTQQFVRSILTSIVGDSKQREDFLKFLEIFSFLDYGSVVSAGYSDNDPAGLLSCDVAQGITKSIEDLKQLLIPENMVPDKMLDAIEDVGTKDNDKKFSEDKYLGFFASDVATSMGKDDDKVFQNRLEGLARNAYDSIGTTGGNNTPDDLIKSSNLLSRVWYVNFYRNALIKEGHKEVGGEPHDISSIENLSAQDLVPALKFNLLFCRYASLIQDSKVSTRLLSVTGSVKKIDLFFSRETMDQLWKMDDQLFVDAIQKELDIRDIHVNKDVVVPRFSEVHQGDAHQKALDTMGLPSVGDKKTSDEILAIFGDSPPLRGAARALSGLQNYFIRKKIEKAAAKVEKEGNNATFAIELDAMLELANIVYSSGDNSSSQDSKALTLTDLNIDIAKAEKFKKIYYYAAEVSPALLDVFNHRITSKEPIRSHRVPETLLRLVKVYSFLKTSEKILTLGFFLLSGAFSSYAIFIGTTLFFLILMFYHYNAIPWTEGAVATGLLRWHKMIPELPKNMAERMRIRMTHISFGGFPRDTAARFFWHYMWYGDDFTADFMIGSLGWQDPNMGKVYEYEQLLLRHRLVKKALFEEYGLDPQMLAQDYGELERREGNPFNTRQLAANLVAPEGAFTEKELLIQLVEAGRAGYSTKNSKDQGLYNRFINRFVGDPNNLNGTIAVRKILERSRADLLDEINGIPDLTEDQAKNIAVLIGDKMPGLLSAITFKDVYANKDQNFAEILETFFQGDFLANEAFGQNVSERQALFTKFQNFIQSNKDDYCIDAFVEIGAECGAGPFSKGLDEFRSRALAVQYINILRNNIGAEEYIAEISGRLINGDKTVTEEELIKYREALHDRYAVDTNKATNHADFIIDYLRTQGKDIIGTAGMAQRDRIPQSKEAENLMHLIEAEHGVDLANRGDFHGAQVVPENSSSTRAFLLWQELRDKLLDKSSDPNKVALKSQLISDIKLGKKFSEINDGRYLHLQLAASAVGLDFEKELKSIYSGKDQGDLGKLELDLILHVSTHGKKDVYKQFESRLDNENIEDYDLWYQSMGSKSSYLLPIDVMGSVRDKLETLFPGGVPGEISFMGHFTTQSMMTVKLGNTEGLMREDPDPKPLNKLSARLDKTLASMYLTVDQKRAVYAGEEVSLSYGDRFLGTIHIPDAQDLDYRQVQYLLNRQWQELVKEQVSEESRGFLYDLYRHGAEGLKSITESFDKVVASYSGVVEALSKEIDGLKGQLESYREQVDAYQTSEGFEAHFAIFGSGDMLVPFLIKEGIPQLEKQIAEKERELAALKNAEDIAALPEKGKSWFKRNDIESIVSIIADNVMTIVVEDTLDVESSVRGHAQRIAESDDALKMLPEAMKDNDKMLRDARGDLLDFSKFKGIEDACKATEAEIKESMREFVKQVETGIDERIKAVEGEIRGLKKKLRSPNIKDGERGDTKYELAEAEKELARLEVIQGSTSDQLSLDVVDNMMEIMSQGIIETTDDHESGKEVTGLKFKFNMSAIDLETAAAGFKMAMHGKPVIGGVGRISAVIGTTTFLIKNPIIKRLDKLSKQKEAELTKAQRVRDTVREREIEKELQNIELQTVHIAEFLNKLAVQGNAIRSASPEAAARLDVAIDKHVKALKDKKIIIDDLRVMVDHLEVDCNDTFGNDIPVELTNPLINKMYDWLINDASSYGREEVIEKLGEYLSSREVRIELLKQGRRLLVRDSKVSLDNIAKIVDLKDKGLNFSRGNAEKAAVIREEENEEHRIVTQIISLPGKHSQAGGGAKGPARNSTEVGSTHEANVAIDLRTMLEMAIYQRMGAYGGTNQSLRNFRRLVDKFFFTGDEPGNLTKDQTGILEEQMARDVSEALGYGEDINKIADDLSGIWDEAGLKENNVYPGDRKIYGQKNKMAKQKEELLGNVKSNAVGVYGLYKLGGVYRALRQMYFKSRDSDYVIDGQDYGVITKEKFSDHWDELEQAGMIRLVQGSTDKAVVISEKISIPKLQEMGFGLAEDANEKMKRLKGELQALRGELQGYKDELEVQKRGINSPAGEGLIAQGAGFSAYGMAEVRIPELGTEIAAKEEQIRPLEEQQERAINDLRHTSFAYFEEAKRVYSLIHDGEKYPEDGAQLKPFKFDDIKNGIIKYLDQNVEESGDWKHLNSYDDVIQQLKLELDDMHEHGVNDQHILEEVYDKVDVLQLAKAMMNRYFHSKKSGNSPLFSEKYKLTPVEQRAKALFETMEDRPQISIADLKDALMSSLNDRYKDDHERQIRVEVEASDVMEEMKYFLEEEEIVEQYKTNNVLAVIASLKDLAIDSTEYIGNENNRIYQTALNIRRSLSSENAIKADDRWQAFKSNSLTAAEQKGLNKAIRDELFPEEKSVEEIRKEMFLNNNSSTMASYRIDTKINKLTARLADIHYTTKVNGHNLRGEWTDEPAAVIIRSPDAIFREARNHRYPWLTSLGFNGKPMRVEAIMPRPLTIKESRRRIESYRTQNNSYHAYPQYRNVEGVWRPFGKYYDDFTDVITREDLLEDIDWNTPYQDVHSLVEEIMKKAAVKMAELKDENGNYLYSNVGNNYAAMDKYKSAFESLAKEVKIRNPKTGKIETHLVPAFFELFIDRDNIFWSVVTRITLFLRHSFKESRIRDQDLMLVQGAQYAFPADSSDGYTTNMAYNTAVSTWNDAAKPGVGPDNPFPYNGMDQGNSQAVPATVKFSMPQYDDIVETQYPDLEWAMTKFLAKLSFSKGFKGNMDLFNGLLVKGFLKIPGLKRPMLEMDQVQRLLNIYEEEYNSKEKDRADFITTYIYRNVIKITGFLLSFGMPFWYGSELLSAIGSVVGLTSLAVSVPPIVLVPLFFAVMKMVGKMLYNKYGYFGGLLTADYWEGDRSDTKERVKVLLYNLRQTLGYVGVSAVVGLMTSGVVTAAALSITLPAAFALVGALLLTKNLNYRGKEQVNSLIFSSSIGLVAASVLPLANMLGIPFTPEMVAVLFVIIGLVLRAIRDKKVDMRMEYNLKTSEFYHFYYNNAKLGRLSPFSQRERTMGTTFSLSGVVEALEDSKKWTKVYRSVFKDALQVRQRIMNNPPDDSYLGKLLQIGDRWIIFFIRYGHPILANLIYAQTSDKHENDMVNNAYNYVISSIPNAFMPIFTLSFLLFGVSMIALPLTAGLAIGSYLINYTIVFGLVSIISRVLGKYIANSVQVDLGFSRKDAKYGEAFQDSTSYKIAGNVPKDFKGTGDMTHDIFNITPATVGQIVTLMARVLFDEIPILNMFYHKIPGLGKRLAKTPEDRAVSLLAIYRTYRALASVTFSALIYWVAMGASGNIVPALILAGIMFFWVMDFNARVERIEVIARKGYDPGIKRWFGYFGKRINNRTHGVHTPLYMALRLVGSLALCYFGMPFFAGIDLMSIEFLSDIADANLVEFIFNLASDLLQLILPLIALGFYYWGWNITPTLFRGLETREKKLSAKLSGADKFFRERKKEQEKIFEDIIRRLESERDSGWYDLLKSVQFHSDDVDNKLAFLDLSMLSSSKAFNNIVKLYGVLPPLPPEEKRKSLELHDTEMAIAKVLADKGNIPANYIDVTLFLRRNSDLVTNLSNGTKSREDKDKIKFDFIEEIARLKQNVSLSPEMTEALVKLVFLAGINRQAEKIDEHKLSEDYIDLFNIDGEKRVVYSDRKLATILLKYGKYRLAELIWLRLYNQGEKDAAVIQALEEINRIKRPTARGLATDPYNLNVGKGRPIIKAANKYRAWQQGYHVVPKPA